MKIPNTRRQLQSINIIIKSVTLPLLLISITTMLSSKALQIPNELASSNSNKEQAEAEVEHSMNAINRPTNVSGTPLPPSINSDSSSSLVSTNFYSNVQGQKFRVNVSNICERNQMRATIRMNRPFYGLIHTKDKRRRPACSLEGNGEQSYAMEIGYTLNPSDPNHCGVVSHQLPAARNVSTVSNQNQQQQQQQTANQPSKAQLTLSVVLVVRLHKSIEFSDDRYFLLSCANRCTKPDCSPTGTNSQQEDSSGRLVASSLLQSLQGPNRNPSVASESILSSSSSSMALRNNNNNNNINLLDGNNNNNNKSRTISLAEVRPVNHLWPTEKCDTMLDMKFQWLVKLCWVLSTLLGVILCAILYMCLNLSQNARSGSIDSTGDNKKAASNRIAKISKLNSQRNKTLNGQTMSLGSTKIQQMVYSPPTQTENISWNGTPNSPSGPNHHHHNHHRVNQMRDDNDNIYLAKQQQQQHQLIFANPLNLMGNQHQTNHHLVLGRSAELANGNGHPPVKQPLAARVKRRRSIGSSMAPGYRGQDLDSYDKSTYHLGGMGAATNNLQAGRYSLANQRAKSRSQTTIYYEQSQDPFKTVPFNSYSYGNTSANHPSYQSSDSENSNRVYLASDFAGTEVYGMPTAAEAAATTTTRTPLESRLQTFASNLNSDESSASHSMPHMEVAHMVIPASGANNHSPNNTTTTNANNRQDMLRKHGSRTSHLKGSSFIAPPQVETIQVQAARKLISQPQQQQQQQPISQFDPQNSRQLIDLIQHKHRQQMEEANLTAANLQSSEMFLEIQRQRQQQQNQSDQHNSLNGRPPWR